MFLLSELRRFQTRKRSSEGSTWVAWAAILGVAIVTTSVLAATQISLMSKNDVRFFNIRAAVTDDFRGVPEEGVAVDARTPMVFVGREKVLVGAMTGVVAPRPDSDLVLLEARDWRKTIVERVRGWKRARDVFPARVVAVAAPLDGTLDDAAKLLGAVVEAVTEINNGFSPGFGAPVPVMVSMKPSLLASGQAASAP